MPFLQKLPTRTVPENLRDKISHLEVLRHVPEPQFLELFFPLKTRLPVPAPEPIEFSQHFLEQSGLSRSVSRGTL